MKVIRVKKSWEPFEVDVDGTVIRCRIDCRDETVNKLGARVVAASDKAKALQKMKVDASDAKKLDELSRKLAKLIGPVIVDAIGQESYDEILIACGDGEKLPAMQCSLVMTQVFATIAEAYAERLGAIQEMTEKKAAHYLPKAMNHAQPETDRV